MLRRIYRHLQRGILPDSPVHRRQRTLEVLELLSHLKHETLCIESYRLFLTIMDTVDSNKAWLWHPAALSLIGAFKWKVARPHVEKPASLMRFLTHCLSEEEKGVVLDLPVERMMLALAGAPTEVIQDAIAGVDFTHPLFFNGICRALRSGAPYLLRRATVTFLRHLDKQLFNTNNIFSEGQVREFIAGWSSSAGESWGTDHGRLLAEALFGTLMGMLDSPFWRGHIPQDRWSILTLLGGMDEGQIPPSFYRCAKNPAIIHHLETYIHGPNILAQWAAILWAKYPDLSEEVKLQLENSTKRISAGPSAHTISSYLAIVDGQIEQTKARINSHTSWSFGDDVARLRTRHATLLFARGVLKGIQNIPL